MSTGAKSKATPTEVQGDRTDAPSAVQTLIQQAARARASDIHVQMQGDTAEVCFRLDGVLTPVTVLAPPLAERVVGRIKFLARLKTYQESLPQDGRINRGELGTDFDVRVATYPTVRGEKLVLRLFQLGTVQPMAGLGLPEPASQLLSSFLKQPSGLLLLTGPAGSGKTTTIYACLQHLTRSGGRHIITIEDPVEQVIPGVMQTEINEAIGLNFACAARHLLRQDPQVLVIGEIRDEETAQLAVRAGLTGHLVISTLHAGSCRGVVERLHTMCPDRVTVASALQLIFNQRLVRALCPECHGEQCSQCYQTGYRGRIPLVEWLRITPEMHQAIVKGEFELLRPDFAMATAAREILRQGRSNPMELERVLGQL